MNPVLLAVIASVFWGLGTVLQKHGMATSFPKISLGEFFSQIGAVLKTLLTNWVWLLGLLMMVGGMTSFATALSRADLSIVQPIACLTGVWAAIVGVVFLKERVRPIEWLGIGLVFLGVIAISLSGGEPSSQVPSNTALLGFTVVSLVLIGASFGLRAAGLTIEFTFSLIAGLNFGLANLMGKLLTQRVVLDVGAPFSFGRAAVWGSILTDYPVYIVIGTNILGGALFQTAFANGRASVVSPIVTIVSTVIPIIAAFTIFGEAIHAGHIVGMVVVLVGTGLLAVRTDASAPAKA